MTKVTVVPGKPGEPERREVLYDKVLPSTLYPGAQLRMLKERIYPATPAEPDKVVIETDRETAEILATLVGSITGPGPVRAKTEPLYCALFDVLPERQIYNARVGGISYTLTDNIYWKLA